MTNPELGRAEILRPPPDPSPSLHPALDPDKDAKFLTVAAEKERLEHLALRAYISALETESGRPSDRLNAAKAVSEMIGIAGSSKRITVVAENAQINQFNEKPELLGHLRKAGEGIAQISNAETTDLHIAEAGRGE